MNELINQLNWRYATKEFDAEKKLSEDQLNYLIESARLTATSFGLQPIKLIVVTDPELRTKLVSAAYGQNQIKDASHLLILAANLELGPEQVNSYIQNISQTRGVPVDALEGFKNMMLGFLDKMSAEQKLVWAKKQAYIALGTILTAAALGQIDACPMEGFDPAQFDEILGLKDLNLTSVVVCPVGFRAETDLTANYKKVRFSVGEFLISK